MKNWSLLTGIFIMAIGAWQASLPTLVQEADQRLKDAKSMKIDYTVQVVGEAPKAYQLTFAKPLMFRVDSDAGSTLCDGKSLYTYRKVDNSYEVSPVTPEALMAFGSRPEVWGWSGFFNPKSLEELASAKVGANRTIKGQPTTEVTATTKAAPNDSITLYIDQKLGIARSYRIKKGTSETIVMAGDITVSAEDVDATKFAFSAPAGAKKVEASDVAAPGYPAIQAILIQTCMPCHSMQRNSAGIQLTNYDGVMAVVTPGKPQDSLIVKSLRGTGGVSKMPKNKPAMPEERIKQIEAWIAAGAKP